MKAGLASRGYSPTAVENAFSGVTSAEIASGVTPDGVATLKWIRPGETESTAVLSLSATSTTYTAQAIGQAGDRGKGRDGRCEHG